MNPWVRRMSRVILRLALRGSPVGLVCLWGAIGSCAKATPDKASGKAAPRADASSVCDRKLLSAGDVSGILRLPITGMKNNAGDPQSCKFTTSDLLRSITISLRPGLGKATAS